MASAGVLEERKVSPQAAAVDVRKVARVDCWVCVMDFGVGLGVEYAEVITASVATTRRAMRLDKRVILVDVGEGELLVVGCWCYGVA